jgi:hypothetical protein
MSSGCFILRWFEGRSSGCRRIVAGLAAAMAAVAVCAVPGTGARAAVRADHRPAADGVVLSLVHAAVHAPVVSSVSPDAGPLAGGRTVTVLGSDFTKVKSVKFGTTAGTHVKIVSSGKLTVTVPAHAVGTVDVRVAAAAGTSAVSAHGRYTFDVKPVVLSVSPSAGPITGGTVVTVRGSGFTGVESVLFGATAGSKMKVVSGSELTVASPAHAAGRVDVRVTTPGGTSAVVPADRFSYIAPLSPVSGVKAGKVTATEVTLTWSDPSGSGFSGVMIRRSEGAKAPASTTAGTLVADTGPGVKTYANTGLTPGTEYGYALFAHDGSGYSAAATIIVTTGKPSAVDVSGVLSQNTTWSPEGASAYILQGNVTVPAGVTLTVEPGTVIKASGTELTVAGVLDAVGSSSSPVTFTSFNDNSVGGATGSGSPKAGDWPGIIVWGSADIENAAVRYASTGVEVSGGPVTIKDDVFVSPVYYAVDADTGSSSPVVEGNSVTGVGTVATGDPADCVYYVQSLSLDFGLLGGNTAAGAAPDLCFAVSGNVVASTVPAGSLPWVAAGSSGETGSPDMPGASLVVPAGVTLTVAPGVVIKTAETGSSYGWLVVAGVLDAVGSSSSPVTFTSFNDNSVGGATGSGSPKAGDWPGIIVWGSADIENAVISYASTAINATGVATFRGTFTDNTMDISACDWNSTTSCGVDAAYTNWGDGSTGPFPASGPLVCGAVTVSPWLPGGSQSDVFGDGNCDGSTTPDNVLASAEQNYSDGIAGEQIQCDDGFQDACQAIQTAEACLSAAYGLAESQSPFTLPALGGDVVDAGSNWLESQEESVVSSLGAVTEFVGDMLGAVGTILDIASAYNQCDP